MSSARPPGPLTVLDRDASRGSDATTALPVAGGGGGANDHPPARRSARGGGRLGLLIMAITLLVLIFLTGFGTWSLHNNRTTGRSDARQGVLRSARVASAFAGELVDTLEGDLQLLSFNPAFAKADPAAISTFLQGLKPMQAIFTSGLGWIDPSGLARASSNPGQQAVLDVSDRGYFQTALKGTPNLSPGLISRRTRQRILVFAVPTRGSDLSVNGVLTGSLQLSQLNPKALKSLFGTADLTAYDSTRHLVLGPDVQRLGDPIPAALTAATRHHVDGLLPDGVLSGSNGERQVTAFAKLTSPEWILAVQEPTAELYGAVDRQYDRSLTFLLVLSIASLLGAGFAASKLDAWHRRVADERARLAAVIDRLPAGVAVVGPDSRIEMANSSALSSLGALGGDHTPTSVGAEVPPTVIARLAAEVDSPDGDIAVVIDGVERYFSVRSTPVGGRRGGVGAVTLVEETTARQAEERRRTASADLLAAISVGETTATIAQAVVDRSGEAIGCDWCALVMVGSNDGKLVTLASDPDPVWLTLVEGDRDSDRSIAGRAIAEQRIVDLVARREEGFAGPERTVVLPLQSAGRAMGAVALGYRRASERAEIGELTAFAAQVALAVDRARRREIEHDVSLTLQRTLLASAPVHEVDLSVALRYQPAADQMLVGGDFYDVIPLDDVSHLLVIGDVVGHGLEAATTMGQLKIAIRAFAQETRSPARILSKLDEFVSDQLQSARYSTAAMVVVDRADGVLRAAVAGHPPPLMRHEDGTVSPLPVVQQPLLGLPPAGGRSDLETPLMSGATGLCLYTDGLIERPDLLLDEGIARLTDALAHAEGSDVERTAEQLMDLVGAGPHRDDVALLYALIHA